MSLFSATTAGRAPLPPSDPPTYFGFAASDAEWEQPDPPEHATAGGLVAVCARVRDAVRRLWAGSDGRGAGKIFGAVLALGLPGLATPAAAQPGAVETPPQKWQIELGLGVVAGAKYPGSGGIEATPVPLVSVTYNNRLFVSSRQGVGAYLIQIPHFTLGASIGIATDTRYSGQDVRLRGLPKIKPGGLASLFAEYELGPVAVEAAVHERIGTVNGVFATVGATYRVRLTPDWSITAGPELKIQSASLNNAFFGVSPEASLSAAAYGNKISPYRLGAGIGLVSGMIASQYRLSDHWALMAEAGLGVLVGRDGNSPLTRQRLQPELGLFAMYRF